jgi:hypothetical protein
MELEAVFGHYYQRDGGVVESVPPGIVVERPPSPAKTARGRGRDTLFVHLALSSRETPTAVLYRDLTDTLASTFYASTGSVTAALRKAIRAANEYLMRHNVRVQGVDKQQGGITCAVLRDEEIFIAQAGPSLAFVGHQGRIERLPPRRPGDAAPLGMSYGVDTRFYHSWIHPGDVLLLTDGNLERHTNEVIGSAVIYEGVTAGIKNLAALANADEQLRLLLVEFVASEMHRPAPAPDLGDGSAAAESFVEEAVSREPLVQEPLPEFSPSVDKSPVKPAGPTIKVDVGGGARRVASGLALGVAKLIGGVGLILERLFSGGEVDGQAVKQDTGPSPLALGMLAVLIPIIVGLVVVAVFTQRGRAEQFQDLLTRMGEESELAQAAAGDPAAARVHWEQVMELSSEALRLRPAHETVLQFRKQSRDALDVLDQVTRLATSSLYEYKGEANPMALAVQSLAVYVLDGDLDYVYRHLLESDLQPVSDMDPETLLFKHQAVGGDATGELVDLVWFPKSGEIREDTVAILDATGLLLNYRLSWGEVTSSRLVTPAAWSRPVAVSVYGDNFYVLDAGAGEIWKYKAQGGGYPNAPNRYLIDVNEDGDQSNDIDLSQMVDMTIDRDGSLYLLGRDGQVFKFFGGERKQFALEELQEPLVEPSAIFCSLTGLNPFCYIADPGSGRIIQTTPQGLFWAQYKAREMDLTDPFAQIDDIYVLEAPLLRIYVTSGNSLLVASLE